MTAPITTIKPRGIDTTGDFVVNSLSSTGNVSAGNIKTNNLLYANGTAYVFNTSAGGTNTQIQFNDGNNFAGNANLTFNKTTGTLTVAQISGNGSSLTSVNALTLNNRSDTYFATSTQGAKADTALQAANLVGYATETYVGNSIANLVASAPAALDTLNELANALGNDSSYSTTITNALANKLSTSNFASTANTWINTQSTSNLSEGTNQYYTVTRANSAIDARVTKSFVDNLAVVANIANVAYSVAGANVTGIVANATYATSAGSSTTAATVTTNAQPNITSVGTLASLTVTANITSGNANLGNLVTGNYFTGNGSLLTSLTGANVTGTVANATYAVSAGSATTAGTVTTAAQPNITSVGTLTSLSITGDVTSGNANLGNNVTANFFTGNGSLLTGISASTANSVAGSNVSGQVANALVAGTVYTNAQPNITSVGTLSSLTVSGVTTLGNVGNVKITGGANGQYLKTDGTGNLTWAASAGGGTSLTYTASTTPPGTANVADQWFNTSSNTLYEYLNDGSANYWVDIQSPTVATSTANTAMNIGSFNTRSYTGTGAQVNFTITSGLNVSTVLVVQDGVVQTPTSDYTISGVTLTFTTAPANGSTIQIRELGYAVPVTSNLASVSSVLVNGTLAISTGNLSVTSNTVTGNLSVTSNITSTSLRAQSMVMGIIFGG
jgi:plasmid maintenance system antidote protein VapI